MKNFSAYAPFVSAVAFFVAFPHGAFGEEIAHAVCAAEVFSDRAVVTRAGTAHLQKGKNEIVFSGIRDNIDLRSIRAETDGVPAGVEILGVSWERHVSKTVDNKEIARLAGELRALRRERTALADRVRVMQNRESLAQKYLALFLRSVSEQSASTPLSPRDTNGVPAGENSAPWDTSSEPILALIETSRENCVKTRAEIVALDEKIARKEEALRRIYGNGGDARRTLSLVVSLDSPAEQDAKIPVSYTTRGAYWFPQYDVRLLAENSASATADFSYNGLVFQNTGEDWRDVRLTLSTAQPHVSAFPPETPPVALSGRKLEGDAQPELVKKQEEVASTETANRRSANDFAAPSSAAAAARSFADEEEFSGVREQGASATFEIAGTHSLLSDSTRPHRVSIARKTFENVELSAEAAPRLRSGIYLRASVKNETPFPLLAGDVNLYRESGFVGKSTLKFAPVNAAFPFFAGTIDGLSCAVEKIAPYRANGKKLFSMAGKNAVAEGEIYTLTNITGTPRKVRVRSQITVSEIDDVKIEILSSPVEHVPATTPGYMLEKDTGLLYWDVDVPANGETRLVLSTQTVTEKK